MGLSSGLKKRALNFSQKAMERLLADEKRAMQIADAIGKIQRGKQALDRTQDRLLHAFSYATKGDLKSLGKQLSALKRRARDLDEALEKLL